MKITLSIAWHAVMRLLAAIGPLAVIRLPAAISHVATIALVALSPPAQAQTDASPTCSPARAGPPCEAAETPTNAGNGDLPDASIGNPVHPATGHKYQLDTDAAPLPGLMGLEIRRHYNSRYASLAGPFGRGWSLSYDTRLFPPTRPGGLVQIIQGDGRRRSFLAPADDAMQRLQRQGGEAGCTQVTDGFGQLSATAWGWRWVWPQRHELRFDPQGFLLSAGPVGAADEDRLRFVREPDGRLRTIIDTAGRQMQLDYDAQGRVSRIRHPLGDWQYHHDSLGQLTQVTAPDGSERHYRYEDTGLRGYLTGIDAARRGEPTAVIGRWQYDAGGRAIRFTRGDGSHLDIEYDVAHDAANTAAGAAGFAGDPDIHITRMRNGNGAVTTYLTRVIAGQWRLQQVSGPGCAECGPSNLRFAYDARGNLAARWPLGRPGQAFTRDAQGRVIAIHRVPWPDSDPSTVPTPAKATAAATAAATTATATATATSGSAAGRTKAHSMPRASRTARTDRLPSRATVPVAGRPVLRIEYPDAFTNLPSRLLRPSQVTDGWVQTDLDHDDQGRLTRLREQGFSPMPTADRTGVDGASPIVRETRFRIAATGARSRVVAVDGPARNGPTASPADSDIAEQDFDPETGLWLRERLPDGIVRRVVERDAGGREAIVEVEDGPHRQRIHTRHDLQGRIVEQRVEGWTIDNRGNPTPGSTVQSNWSRNYDLRGSLIQERDAAGRTRQIDHDAAGRPISFADVSGHRASLTLNAEGQIERLALHRPGVAAPHRAAYLQRDLDGRIIGALWPDGRWQRTSFHRTRDGTRIDAAMTLDQEGRLTWTGEPAAILGDEATPNGKRTRLVHRDTHSGEDRAALNPVIRWHDDFGRIVLERYADHGARSYRHDDASRLIEATDGAGVTLRFQVDHAGRQTAIQGVDGERVRYRYQGSRRVATVEPEIETDHVTDALGRPIRTTTRIRALPGMAWEQSQQFDPISGLVTGARLADGRQLLIKRTPVNQGATAHALQLRSAWWTAIADRIAAWSPGWIPKRWPLKLIAMLPTRVVIQDLRIDPFDGPVHWRHGNGLVVHRKHDLAGRLQRIRVAGQLPSPLVDQVMHHRAGPRIHRLEDRTGQHGDLTFGYDALGRLKTVVRKSGTTATALPIPAPSRPGMAADWKPIPARATDASPLRDAAGRLREDARFRYHYTPFGQLAGIDQRSDDTPVARFQYDSQHRRFQRQIRTRDVDDTTYYLWNGHQVSTEIDRHGKIRKQFLRLDTGHGNLPIAVLETAPDGSTRLLAIHTDHRAAPMALSDETQRIVWRAELSAYGLATEIRSTDGTTLDLRLAGQIADPGIGLVDNHHRSYDPVSGNYLQPDPLGYPDGPDPYRYAASDPINRNDPSGLYSADVHYYMTFFLAVTAGFTLDEARTIATATQYVDDNPKTWPLDDRNLVAMIGSTTRNQSQLVNGHFTLSDPNPNSPGYGRTLPQYRNSQIYINDSPQLAALLAASRSSRLSRVGQIYVLALYTHGLGDTVSHRDGNDLPIDALVKLPNGCYLGIGHGLFGHTPDTTYNEGWIQIGIDSDGKPIMKPWEQERRTLIMEQMIYDRLRAEKPSGGKATDFEEIRTTLVDFNAIRESGDKPEKKIELLMTKLESLGYGKIDLLNSDIRDPNAFGYSRERGDEIFRQAMIGADGPPIPEEDTSDSCSTGGAPCEPK